MTEVEGCLFGWMVLSQESDSERKCENCLLNYILFTEALNIQNRIISQASEVLPVGKVSNGKLVMPF